MEFLLILILLVGAVWCAVAIRFGSLPLLAAGLLPVVCALGPYFWGIDAAGYTWTLDRVFLLLLVGAYGVQRYFSKTDPKPITRLEWILAAFYGLLVFSMFTHDYHQHTATEVSITMHLVNGYLIPLVLYWIARQSLLTESSVPHVQWVLAIFGVYLCITAVLEYAQMWSLVFPAYIADPKVGIHFGRARGPMVQAARFGFYLNVCVAATWLLLGWQQRLGRLGLVVAVALLPLYAAATYFTYTRSVWMGAFLVAVTVAVLTLRGRIRTLVLGGMAAAALCGVIAKWDKLVAFERETSAAVTADSTYMRASFAYVSWKMFQDKPLTGFGFGQFSRENRYYLNDRDTNLQLEHIRGYIHHNTYLSLLVELGIPGLVLYMAVIAGWIWFAWRIGSADHQRKWIRAHGVLFLAAMGPYFLQMAFREVSYAVEENGLIFLLAGMVVGLALRHTPQRFSQQAAAPAERRDRRAPEYAAAR